MPVTTTATLVWILRGAAREHLFKKLQPTHLVAYWKTPEARKSLPVPTSLERFYDLEYIHSKHLPNYGPRLLRALCTRVRKIAPALRDEDAAADALKKQQQQEKKKKK